MRKVIIEKEKLTEILVKFREEHQRNYNKVIAGWKEKAKAKLIEAIDTIEKEGLANLDIKPLPPAYLQDYDMIIEMMKYQDDVIELDEKEVRQYVMNEWPWKKNFEMAQFLYSE